MNTSGLRRLLLVSVAAAGVASANVASSARAAEASPWVADAHSALRLIAGSAPKSAGEPLRAGVELKLAPGWKTYWRYPGDSGVPPRFDFAQSSNVKSVTVAWPAPQRFTDPSGSTIGYKGGVIWPVNVEPKVAGEPVELRLKLDYAVCENICIPVEAAADVTVTGAPSAYDSELAEAERRVPQPESIGKGLPTIQAVRRDTGGERPRITVDVAAPADQPVDLFVEGPTPDWALPLPAPQPAPAGIRRFSFDVDGLPPGATIDGAQLRFTLVTPERAAEVVTRVD
jgi:DsbC/DsbD-like thiol-disulfide interchange protein